MRLLHTADWHLGNTMHDIDRIEEQDKFLKWLKDEMIEREIDTLVVAGDIFDTKTPPTSAQKMYYRFLASLVDTTCQNVVITGGNHDSGSFLDAPKDMLEVLNIHTVGMMDNKEIVDLVFDLKNNAGECVAICAAVPFVKEMTLRSKYELYDVEDGKFSDKAYEKLYGDVLEAAKKAKGDRDIPIIATGHLYAAGLEGRYENVEKEEKTDDGVRILDIVGNLGKVHVSCFPNEFDYIALGHIHYATMVGKNSRIRYSGSPFVMGFDEAKIPRYVLQVELGNASHDISVSPIEVPESVRYERITGSAEQILGSLRNMMSLTDDMVYIEIAYKGSDYSLLQEEVEKIKLPNNVQVVSWKPVTDKGTLSSRLEDYDIKTVNAIDPEVITRQLILCKLPLMKDIEKSGKTEQEIDDLKEEQIKKYLPYFLDAIKEVELGADQDEDN